MEELEEKAEKAIIEELEEKTEKIESKEETKKV